MKSLLFISMDPKALDYSKIPVTALQKSTQSILSAGLNQNKIIPNKDGLPRDWRGLAHLMGLNGVETGWIAASPDPLVALLNFWNKKGNLGLLQEYLQTIDRYDVYDDTRPLFENDSLEYLEKLDKINTPITDVSLESDKLILTSDDVLRLEQGLEPQKYDAYVLYAEEDSDFAAEVIEKMEKDYNLKLCVRDRDLIGGVQFEHDAVTKLIAERCRRLVVIVSPNFLKSKANKFFVTFAQALGIDIRERKVIPILYQRCDIPPELSYYFLLDYNRAGKLWNFWDKLRDSIQGPELTTEKPTKTTTTNDYWMSKTRFEEKSTEKATGSEIPEPVPEKVEQKKKNVQKNVYSMIKNSFVKTRKTSSEYKTPRESNPLLSGLKSFDKVVFEPLENSSGFEEEKENGENKKKVKEKKKWFKKKKAEALMS